MIQASAKCRVGGDRTIELVERDLGAAEPLLREADQIVGRRKFRLGLDDLAGELDPLFEPALLAMDRRQPEQRGKILFSSARTCS